MHKGELVTIFYVLFMACFEILLRCTNIGGSKQTRCRRMVKKQNAISITINHMHMQKLVIFVGELLLRSAL